MNRVVFSFDDARLDTYEVAYPILKKQGFPFTINVVTDFVEKQEGYECFGSAGNLSMSFSALKECKDYGAEIACHGHTHQNSVEDVKKNIEVLSSHTLISLPVGFASPHSHLTQNNSQEIQNLIKDGTLSYIRSGIQTRREGLFYTALTVLCRIFKSKRLFWWLNKRNVIKKCSYNILPSVAITKGVTLCQLEYFLSKLNDGESVIFMFHSVLDETAPSYSVDEWAYSKEKFEKFVQKLSDNQKYRVCTTEELIKGE